MENIAWTSPGRIDPKLIEEESSTFKSKQESSQSQSISGVNAQEENNAKVDQLSSDDTENPKQFDLFDEFNSEMEQNEKIELKLTHSKRNEDKKVATMDKILFQMKKNREFESQLMDVGDESGNTNTNENVEPIQNDVKQPSPLPSAQPTSSADQIVQSENVPENLVKEQEQPNHQMETDENPGSNKQNQELIVEGVAVTIPIDSTAATNETMKPVDDIVKSDIDVETKHQHQELKTNVDLDSELMVNKQFDETDFKASNQITLLEQEDKKVIESTTTSSSDPYQLKENFE